MIIKQTSFLKGTSKSDRQNDELKTTFFRINLGRSAAHRFRSNISFQDVNVHGPTQGAEPFAAVFRRCVWAVLWHMAHMAVLLDC